MRGFHTITLTLLAREGAYVRCGSKAAISTDDVFTNRSHQPIGGECPSSRPMARPLP